MNSKHIPIVFVIVGLIAGAGLWHWATTPPPEEKPAAESEPPAARETVPPPEAMAEPPPPAPVVVSAPAPVPAPAVTFDPQAELSTAIQDFARLAQSGDMLTLVQTYMTPDEQAQMGPQQMAEMQAMMQGPAGPMITQMMQAEMQAIQNQTPIYDETGNRATYTRPPGSPGGGDIVFVKVNGRWYRK